MDIPTPDLSEHARKNIEIAARGLIGKCGLTRDDLGDIISELTLDLLTHLPRHDGRRSSSSTFVQVVVAGRSRRILRDLTRDKRILLRDAESLETVTCRDENGNEVTLADMLDGDEAAIALGHSSRSRREQELLRIDVTAVISQLPGSLQACCTDIMNGRSVSELARESGLSRTAFRGRVIDPIRRAFREAGYGDVRAGAGRKFRHTPASWLFRGE